MLIKDVVANKIINLSNKNNISINKLAILSGITQSTLQSIIDGRSKNTTLLTIVRICDSLNITLSEFFNDTLFNDIDTEL